MLTDWPARIQASYFIGPYNLHYLLFSGIGTLLCHHPYCFPNQSVSIAPSRKWRIIQLYRWSSEHDGRTVPRLLGMVIYVCHCCCYFCSKTSENIFSSSYRYICDNFSCIDSTRWMFDGTFALWLVSNTFRPPQETDSLHDCLCRVLYDDKRENRIV